MRKRLPLFALILLAQYVIFVDPLPHDPMLVCSMYLISPYVKGAQRYVVRPREVEDLVAREGLEEVVGELEHRVGDDVVDDVLLVRIGVRIGDAHRI